MLVPLRKTLFSIFMILVLGLLAPACAWGAVNPGVIPGTSPYIDKEIDKNTVPYINAAPKAPSDLKATSTPGKIVLTWTDNSTNEEGFVIERKAGTGEFYPIDAVKANVTTYTDTAQTSYPLHPNEVYYYRVKAVKGSIFSASSNETPGTYYYTYEPQPAYDLQVLPIVYNDTSFKLQWKYSHNLNTANYLEVSKNGSAFMQVASLASSQSTYSVSKSDLVVDVNYTYRIKSQNQYGTSYSNQVVVKIPHLPADPTDFISPRSGSTFVHMQWKDNSDNEQGFLIFRKKRSDNSFDFTRPIAVTGPNVQEYTDTGLEPLTFYDYRLYPFNENGMKVVNLETTQATGPLAPQNLSAAALSASKVKLEWYDPNDSVVIVRYRIERKTEGEDWRFVTWHSSEAAAGFNSWIDESLADNTTYYYRCYAYTGVYISDPSQEVSVTTRGALTLPQNGPIVLGKKVISLSLGSKQINVDNQVFDMDTAPVSTQGRTMLPIRYITEALDASLAWDDATQKVTIVKGDKTIELWIGNNTARVNGQERLIDPDNPEVRPFIAPPGRTMLPLRFITENLGCEVEWDPVLQTVKILYEAG